MEDLIALVIGLILIIGLFALSGLALWGIGAFIIWVFHINFVWTFWHGIALVFILMILHGIFNK